MQKTPFRQLATGDKFMRYGKPPYDERTGIVAFVKTGPEKARPAGLSTSGDDLTIGPDEGVLLVERAQTPA